VSSPEIVGDSDYHSLEITCVQQPDGRWRVFPTLMEAADWPIPITGRDYFDLPTFPDRYLAETFGCFVAWQFLDRLQVWDVKQQAYRAVDVLE
jgi:hypothetical protein